MALRMRPEPEGRQTGSRATGRSRSVASLPPRSSLRERRSASGGRFGVVRFAARRAPRGSGARSVAPYPKETSDDETPGPNAHRALDTAEPGGESRPY